MLRSPVRGSSHREQRGSAYGYLTPKLSSTPNFTGRKRGRLLTLDTHPGGVSPLYAEKVIGGDQNLLAIVGYQDEESPGRKIIELADLPPEERKVVLNEVEYKVKCQVGTFGLSAHADGLGITSSVKGLKPGFVLINHGNEESLRGLAKSLAEELPDARIDVAEPLRPYDFVSSPGKRRVYAFRPGISGISLWRDEPLDSRGAADLWKGEPTHAAPQP